MRIPQAETLFLNDKTLLNLGENMPNKNTSALLLVAHGSRNANANEDLHYVAEELAKKGRYVTVEAAFLEIAKPTIEEGAEKCVRKGAESVVMVPYFLSAGIHARQDLQDFQKLLTANYPEVSFILGEPFGRHPLLLKIVEERATQAEIGQESNNV